MVFPDVSQQVSPPILLPRIGNTASVWLPLLAFGLVVQRHWHPQHWAVDKNKERWDWQKAKVLQNRKRNQRWQDILFGYDTVAVSRYIKCILSSISKEDLIRRVLIYLKFPALKRICLAEVSAKRSAVVAVTAWRLWQQTFVRYNEYA